MLHPNLPRLVFAVLVCVLAAGCTKVQDAILERQLRDRVDHSYVERMDVIRVTLCGTGTPQVDTNRNQACTLVAAGGHLFLFDAGEGAAKTLDRLGAPLDRIDRIFLTHFHSDHINGLGPLVNYRWTWGASSAVQVIGPTGTRDIVDALNTVYSPDIRFRHAHFNPGPENAVMSATEFTLDATTHTQGVFEQDGVVIQAHQVDHHPVDPAVGYTLRYRGAKVFISGDTRVSDAYGNAMQDADLVVHEALNNAMVRAAHHAATGLGKQGVISVTEHVPTYHADTIELARSAQKYHVKHLVLTHLIPAPDNWFTRWLFVKGMDEEYRGEITLGEDGMNFYVPTPMSPLSR